MSLEFWPGTEIRRSTHNGFTMGLTGDRGGFVASIQPSPKARKNPGQQGKRRPIEQFTPEGEFVRQFASIAEAAKSVGVADSNIVRAATGMRQTAGGFKWRYPAAEGVTA